MSHKDEKSPTANAGPTAEVPTLAKDEKVTSEKSSDVERPNAVDSQDEVSAFTRRDVKWTEDEERALVWRLGKREKKLFLDTLCCLEGTLAPMVSLLTRDRHRSEDHPARYAPLPLQLHRVSLEFSLLFIFDDLLTCHCSRTNIGNAK